MVMVIAGGDVSISTRVSADLRKAGVECSISQKLLEDCCRRFATPNGARSLVLVFFGSQQFLPEEITELEQLCDKGEGHVKVIAVGAVSTPSIILQAIRSGAMDYLDINGNLEAELRAVFERVKATQRDSGMGRMFTVLSPVGGAGASVLATNLAAVFAQQQQVCGLLDLKVRGGDLAALLKCNPRHTLLSLAEKAHQLDRAMFDQALTKHECGIHLVASPEPFSDYRQINAQVIQKVVQFARSSCPNVVVDLEDAEHAEQVRTLAGSDRIVIPLRLDFVALLRAKKCIGHLLSCKVQQDHIILVANRTGRAKELPLEAVADVLAMPVEHSIPDDPATVNAANNLGVPFVIASPRSKVSLSIAHLAESLIGAEPEGPVPTRAPLRLLPYKAAAYLSNLLNH